MVADEHGLKMADTFKSAGASSVAAASAQVRSLPLALAIYDLHRSLIPVPFRCTGKCERAAPGGSDWRVSRRRFGRALEEVAQLVT